MVGREWAYRPVHTSWSQRVFLAGGSAVLALLDPERGDMVATLGETAPLSTKALHYMKQQMQSTEEGRAVLREKPRIRSDTVDLASLSKLPPNTFGYAYSHFMTSRNFTPDSRQPVRFVDDPELAYVMTRYRECHDLWHVLIGLPTAEAAEMAQKWFELLQTGLPVCLLSGVVGPTRLPLREQSKFWGEAVPWAIRCHRNLAQPLLSAYLERHFERDLASVRADLGILPFPEHLTWAQGDAHSQPSD